MIVLVLGAFLLMVGVPMFPSQGTAANSTAKATAVVVEHSLAATSARESPKGVAVLINVIVHPNVAEINVSRTQPFSAYAFDSVNGNVTRNATFAWTMYPDSLGVFNLTTGAFVLFKTSTVAMVGHICVNATYDVSTLGACAMITSVPLSITATAKPLDGAPPLFVTFTATATGGVTPYSYIWKFGDGTTSNLQNPTHTYQAIGNYSVVVNVTDDLLHRAATNLTVKVFYIPVVYMTPNTAALPQRGSAIFTVNSTLNGTPYFGLHYSWTMSNPLLGTLNTTTGNVVLFIAGTTDGVLDLCAQAPYRMLTTNSACAVIDIEPYLNVSTVPNACGSVALGTSVMVSGMSTLVPAGTYTILASPCLGYKFTSWGTNGQVAVSVWNVSLTTMVISGAGGTLFAGFVASTTPPGATKYTIGVTVDPDYCGPVMVNGTSEANGDTVSLAPGAYPITAQLCDGYAFQSWVATGGLSVLATNVNTTVLTVSSSGSLTLTYALAQGLHLENVSLYPPVLAVPTNARLGVSATAYDQLGAAITVPFVWYVSPSTPGHLLETSGKNVTFLASAAAGAGDICVNATYAGTTIDQCGNVTVYSSVIHLLSIAVSPGSAEIVRNASEVFTVTATCTEGLCPGGVVYVWKLSNPALGSLSSASGNQVTFTSGSAIGSETISVSGSMGPDYVIAPTVAITIYIPSTPAPLISTLELVIIIVVIVAVVAVVVALLLLRRRKRNQTQYQQFPQEPQPMYGAPPQQQQQFPPVQVLQ